MEFPTVGHCYQLDQTISALRVVGWYFLFEIKENILYANSGDPDQTPRSAASDLGLRCLSMSHKKDDRLIWVKKSIESDKVSHYFKNTSIAPSFKKGNRNNQENPIPVTAYQVFHARF